MTRKPKFSFLSVHHGSNPEKNERSTTNQRTPISGPSSPAFGSMSKAEELLGPSETGGGTQQPEGLARCHTGRRLRKKCSALSITIAECRFNTSRAHKKAGDAERSKAYTSVHGQADNLSVTSSTDRSIRRKHSTSTIDSHYDPAVAPLAISQQTSASSARDMALRKGCPPVLSPLRYTTFQDSAEKPRHEKHVPKKQPEIAQRKITHVDLTAFFPQFKPLERPLDSHLKIETATSVMVIDSENDSSRPLGLRSWTGRRIIKVTDPPKTTAKDRKVDLQADNDERKGALPLASQLLQPVKDVENWLDDAELEDKFDTMGEQTTLQMFITGDRSSLNSSHGSSDQSSSSVRTMTSQPSPAKIPPQSHPQPDSFNEAARFPTKASTAMIPSYEPPQPNVVHVSKIKHSDLQLESVLALSSSDDDSETDVRPTTRKRRNSRRNASAKGPNPLSRPADPKPSTTQQHHSEGTSDPHASIPLPWNPPTTSPEHSPTLPRRYGHPSDPHSHPAYWPPDMIRTQHPLHPSSHPSPLRKKPPTPTPTPTPATPHHDPIPSSDNPHFRLSRLMAVSPEEEKLLSLMRHKRASMRRDAPPPPRPKTADGDRPPSSFFEPDMTLFPKPPRHAHAHTLRRLSSEDLRLRSRGGEGYRSASSSEEEDGEGEEDGSNGSAVPSPALSAEEAPLTPASVRGGEGEGGVLEDGDGEEERYDEFGSEGQVRPGVGRGHARKRTMSTLGSVLCLDGVEERARLREEEEDVAMWGVGRCI
ncbi:hypothetical protein MMC34_002517 [Xylographa carneopallida]|nr:hypothetical protein [Xylographa carneopallida]